MARTKKYLTDHELSIYPDNLLGLDSIFTTKQIQEIIKPTPKEEIEYKIEGNLRYKTVKGQFVKKKLNIIFGFGGWSFSIISKEMYSREIVVHGKLIVLGKDNIVSFREQFGGYKFENATIKQHNNTITAPFNIRNAFKSAATDTLKKCASEFGICWDVYSGDFEEIKPEKKDYPKTKEFERMERFFTKSKNTNELKGYYNKYCNEVTEISEDIENLFKENMNRLLNEDN